MLAPLPVVSEASIQPRPENEPQLSAIAADNPDARLLALGREMESAVVDLNQALEAVNETSKRFSAACPPAPHRKRPQLPAEYAQFSEITSQELDYVMMVAPSHPIAVWGRKLRKLYNRGLTKTELRYLELSKRLAIETGYRAAEEKYDACSERCWELAEKIYALPAQTAEGLLVKVQALDMLDASADMDSDFAKIKPWASVADDIRTMAGHSAAA